MSSSAVRNQCWALALLVALAIGCSRGVNEQQASAPHGPHGGHLAFMSDGAGFQIEFTLEQRRRRMTLYTQEAGGAKTFPLPVDSLSGKFENDGQSIDVTFAADPRVDDPEGRASRFVLPLDQLPQQLLLSDRFVLKLSYNAGGDPVTASIPHSNDHGHEYNHD